MKSGLDTGFTWKGENLFPACLEKRPTEKCILDAFIKQEHSYFY